MTRNDVLILTVLRRPHILDISPPERHYSILDFIARSLFIHVWIEIHVPLSHSCVKNKTSYAGIQTIYMHVPNNLRERTKHLNSRAGSTWYHLRKTNSSSYDVSALRLGIHPSKTVSSSTSCKIKSEDLSNMYTSDGDVHFIGDEDGRIQEASWSPESKIFRHSMQWDNHAPLGTRSWALGR